MDFEFLEGDVPVKLLGYNIPKWLIKPNNTIQPISIGLVCSDGREYYAISKDFNLKEAWNRFQIKDYDLSVKKEYWIRENVLKPIWKDYLENRQSMYEKTYHWELTSEFSYKTMKTIIRWIGKPNKQIAEEIISFTTQAKWQDNPNGKFNVGSDLSNEVTKKDLVWDKPTFYAYYADYDWVAFCWLFGKMMDLPNGFPMYCIDLKQIFDEEELKLKGQSDFINLKQHSHYPKQENEHNALADAKFSKDLHYFLNNI